MAAAAILDLSEVKFDVAWSTRAVRIYLHTKFGEDTSTGGRVMPIYVFSKWRSAAILDFCRIEIGGISVSGTSVLVPEPNLVRICAIATELWPFKWIFKMAAAAILDLSKVKFDVNGSRVVSTSW